MKPQLPACPALMDGMLKASASFQGRDVRLACWYHKMSTLAIEEGGVVVELEFTDPSCLDRFIGRLSALGTSLRGGQP